MELILLLGLCGAVGYLIWKQSSKNQISTNPSKPYSKNDIRIENAEAGAVIHLSGIGPNLEEFDVKIVAKHTYRQGESSWYELEGDKGTDEKVWIDMEEDDELELAISLRKLRLEDLGITKNDLERMDDEEKGSFQFEGQKYHLDDSDSAVFYRYSEDKNADKFYYWDFEAQDGKHYIGVEKWSDGSYDVTLSQAVKPSQLTVYSIK
jgi:hypothetical protein